jgi:putative membrane protein
MYRLILLIAVLIGFAWSGIAPQDTRLTWVLETVPVMIALPLLLATYKKFPLTDLSYTLIAVHAVILMVGGHYAYAKVPLGFWMTEAFLGTQGYIWDTQTDMFWCLIGAVTAILLLSRLHDKYLESLAGGPS